MYRKGSILVRRDPKSLLLEQGGPDSQDQSGRTVDGATGVVVEEAQQRRKVKKVKPYEGMTGNVEVLHEDIIRDAFWSQRPWLLI